MKPRILGNQHIKSASRYILAAALCMIILGIVLRLPSADLRVPLHYGGDALLHATFIKGMIDNGWYWQNNFVGMPVGLKMYDFPAVDNLPGLIIGIISLFTSNAILVLNLFYLLTFPLVTLSSLFVFRQFGFLYITSLFASLLYTFLPYHLMRGESHLFLAAYYPIPLIIMVVLWVSSGKLFPRNVDDQKRFSLRNYRFIVSVLICVVIGSSGIYYPFFSCFFLIVAGAATSVSFKSLRPLIPVAILVAVITATVALNLSPSIFYIYKHGDAKVSHRIPAGAEIYGLKVAQLLLPITGHRVSFLANAKEKYNNSPLVTENDAAALGFIGSIGFLLLLGRLFYRKGNSQENDSSSKARLLDQLSILNISAVLLGTIGSFGSLFAHFISAGIRSYNRISVFIAFFSLLALAIGLESILGKARKHRRGQIASYAAVGLLLIIGILDQTSKRFVPDYRGIKESYLSDSRFINRIEAAVPANGMIFQLPYIPFPEYPMVNRMVDYDHFRAYLHSTRLRWSYGAMKNREGDLWQKQVAGMPTEQFLHALSFAGFNGVYLDRYGYEDNGQAKETELVNVLAVSPVISEDRRLAFFDMAKFNQGLRDRHSHDWEAKQDLALHPLMLDWRGGFSDLETGGGKDWRWSSSEGELYFKNSSQHARKVKLEMSFASGYEQYDDLIISGQLISERLKTNARPSPYSKTITVPPGASVIKFTSTAKRIDALLDSRVLVFRIENFKMTAVD